ncbi:TIGR02269 family lipoprotein [Corallococcus macrosporus]|uniref:Lipoprotein n=1 Tax=Corallococcus macrosporus DSM 14697 TaxID=1189310 RepID=A0A250JPU0_9BACT|nr:TIGR02269 family lipoprotein [Corallococcus macrosporus]ATB45502.1 hypothetical protein MYMAC_001087 [Corallococcus macrosporus DSM 14697]
MNWLLRLMVLCGSLLGVLACGTASPALREWADAEWQADADECHESSQQRCVVLACDEGVCGLFRCEDVADDAVAHGRKVWAVEKATGRPSFRGPGSYRNWWQRRTGIRRDAHPLATAPLARRAPVFIPAIPRAHGKLIKHHLFPQEPRLAAWFRAAGIDIHQFTMVVPERVHWTIHSGKGMGPGGAWNNAWRQFVMANPRPPSRDVIMRHAIELAFRFELSGPVVPYNVPVTPGMSGPRIEAL